MPWIIWIGIAVAAGAAIGIALLFLSVRFARSALRRAGEEARRLVEEARREADTRRQEAEIESRDRVQALERSFEERTRERTRGLEERQRNLDQREKNLDRKASLLGEKHREAEDARTRLQEERARARAAQEDLDRKVAEQTSRLEQVAGMTAGEARRELQRSQEEEARRESAQAVKRIEEEARERAEEGVRWILANSLPKVPAQEISDSLSCRVAIPNDEMKGRIIGREGRNIRSLEMNTGVDIIVDDTPGHIVLSSFDPLRREMARISIEKLIEDGRIHPARIEEVCGKVREEFEQRIQEEGEAAAYDLAIPNLHPKLIRLIGTLKYHGRIGHNLLTHTVEVAHLGGAMALELNVDADLVKRAGLLHEVGQVGGPLGGLPPLLVSAELAGRYNEPEEVVHCLRTLGGEVEPRRVEAVLLGVADQASLQRPGARKVNLETLVSRLRRLEEIACSFAGVQSAYAVKVGKEIRVIVDSARVADAEVPGLSRSIAARIAADQVCTGHVKVSVIRETRAVDYAM